ncbi:endonuclease/exonuclease/phosphatase family protein [Caulobacter sp.]|uniref:endonuclease/exonuclease/phosphatase family protein n=1 Tax=Caulobacter sp. TaxID=78 RepID=UPI003BABB422
MAKNARDEVFGEQRHALVVANTTLAICAVVVGFLALAWFAAPFFWWADVMTLFQPLYAIPAAVLLLISLALRLKLVSAALALALGSMLVILLSPPTRVAAPLLTPSRVVTVATFNVLHQNRRYDDLDRWLRQTRPDIVGLQEVSWNWLGVLQKLHDVYPYSARIASPELVQQQPHGGIELLSRYPILSAEVYAPLGADRLMVSAIVSIEGRPVNVMVLHADTLRARDAWSLRNLYLKTLGQWLGWGLANEGRAHTSDRIVVGDLNTTRWSPHFLGFLRAAKLYDADYSLIPQATRILSKPGRYVFGSPIDHVLTSRGVRSMGCVVGADLGSDHRPLTCRLGLP